MAETVTIGGKTYTKPENAQAGWLAEARKAGTTTPVASPVAQPTQTNPVDSPTPIAQPSQMEAIKKLPQYQDLLNKGYKADDIEKAVAGYKPPQPQVQPQAEIKPAAPIVPAEQVQAPVKKQEPATPVTEKNKTGTMDLLPISEYQDNSSERMNQIISNLNQYRQSAPAFLKDLQTFKDTFMVNGVTRTPEQDKNMLNWYAGYKKGEQLSTLTNGNITDMYNAGTVSSNDLENLRLNNPAKYSEVMNEINKKNELKKYSDELYGTEAEPVQQATPLSQPATTDMSFFDEYKNTINSDEVKTLNNDLLDKQTKIDQLRLEMTSIEDEIKKQYEGTGATESKIGRIIADAQSTVQKQINALGLDYNNTLNKYNSIMNTAADTYKLNLEEANYQNEQKNQKMKELGFYYEYDPKGMTERADTIFNIENPDIDSKDINTARRALNNELQKYYEQFGDIIIRPQSQALNDILAQAKAEGLSLSQALKKNFTDPLQSKSLYGAKLQKSMGLDFGDYTLKQGEDGNWNMQSKVGVGSMASMAGIQGSGNIQQVDLFGKSVGLDTVAVPSIQEAFSDPIMQGIVVGQGHRDQTETIKTMANKYGIPFNANNPAETARALTAAGHQVAAPGYSKHETGMAIDLYDKNGNAPSAEQVKVLNSKGRYQTAGAGDMGHFEYTGGSKGQSISERVNILKSTMSKQARDSFEEALNSTGGDPVLMENLIKDMEIDKYYDRIKDPLNDYQKAEAPLQEINNAFSRIDAVWQSYQSDPKSITSKNTLDQVLVIGLNKILDPGSVVRDSEFARAPEGMSFYNKWEGKIAKIQEGGVGLTDSERNEIINAVTLMKKGQLGAVNTYKNELLLAGKTLNVPEQFIYGMIGGKDKFNIETPTAPTLAVINTNSRTQGAGSVSSYNQQNSFIDSIF